MLYTLGNFTLEELEKEDLELVRAWRNAEYVKKWMFTEDDVTFKNQQRWFVSRKNRDDLIFAFNDNKIGLVYFFNKSLHHRHCEFGFYIGEKKYFESGFGAVMEFMALDLIFSKRRYNRVWCSTLANNKVVISQHHRFGFKREGAFRKHILKQNEYVDVIIQAILNEEWIVIRNQIYETLQRIYKF